MYHLPCKFKRVFIKNHYSSVDKKYYNPGDIEELNPKILHSKLKNVTEDASGFLKYFLAPKTLNSQKYRDLNFVVIPDSNTYESYLDLEHKISGIKLKKSTRTPTNDYDKSVPNTQIIKDYKKVLKIQKEIKGIYLSEIVRYLCNKHGDSYITIIISACRCFYDDIPKDVKLNQKKTTRLDALSYYKNYSKKFDHKKDD